MSLTQSSTHKLQWEWENGFYKNFKQTFIRAGMIRKKFSQVKGGSSLGEKQFALLP
jgi:hypothetical protein